MTPVIYTGGHSLDLVYNIATMINGETEGSYVFTNIT